MNDCSNANPEFNLPFDIYTDVSGYHLVVSIVLNF